MTYYPQVLGANQTGKALVTYGWPPNAVLDAGTMFFFAPSPFLSACVAQEATADANGYMTIYLTQQIPDDVFNGVMLVMPLQASGNGT